MSNETNIFEVATRQKFRFPYKGSISVEDLWDLPVTALDSIFKTLNKQAKQAEEESLLDTKSKEDEETAIKIAIIRRIVEVKKQEQTNRLLEKERKEKKQRIAEILADKEDEALKDKSKEELEKMLAEL